MSKEEKIKKIIELTRELNEMSEGKSGTLIVHGDINDNVSQVGKIGDPLAISLAFNSFMKTNEEFKHLMSAMFGAFLNSNPVDKDIFTKGLELADSNSFGVN